MACSRALRLFVSGIVLVGVAAAPLAARADTGTPALAPPADSQSAPDEASASAIASAYGHPVVVSGETTSTGQVSAQPDGSMQLVENSVPVRAQDASGAWQPLDLSLVTDSSGMLAPRVSASPVEFSAGGSGPLVRVRAADGSWLSESWPAGPLPSPVVDGASATYAGVFPGVSLVVTATATGMSQVLVVSSAQAAANPALSAVRFAVTGASVSAAAGTGDPAGLAASPTASSGSAAVVASDGLASASPSWWDSRGAGASASGPGGTQEPAPVPDAVSSSAITVNAASVAQQSGVTYPVFVDPGWTGGPTAHTFVDLAYPTGTYWNGANSDGCQHVGYVSAGWSDDGRAHTARSMWTMDLHSVVGKVITSAHFEASETWSSTNWDKTEVDLRTLGAFGSGTDWNNQPAQGRVVSSQSTDYGWVSGGSSCPSSTANDTAVSWDATSAVQSAIGQGQNAVNLELAATNADEANLNADSWKKFRSSTALTVNYVSHPSKPSGLDMSPDGFGLRSPAYTNDTTPTLYATSTVSDSGALLNYDFEVWKGYNATSLATFKVQTGYASGQQASWTAAYLPEGQYAWRVKAINSLDTSVDSGWSDWFTFTVDTHLPGAPKLESSGPVTDTTQNPSGAAGGTVGVQDPANPETMKILTPSPATDDVYGYVYAILPTNTQIVWPTNLVCNTSVNGYTTVCPALSNPNGGANQSVTVPFTVPDDTATFAAESFDAAGNVDSATTAGTRTASHSFLANGDYTNVPGGHSWLTDSYVAPAAGTGTTCLGATGTGEAVSSTNPLPDSAASGSVPSSAQPITSLGSGGSCWGFDSTAPPVSGGVLSLDGTANSVHTSGPVIDTSKNFTVAAWLNPTQAGSGIVETALTQQGTNEGTFFLQNTQGRWALCVPTSDSSVFVGACPGSPTGSVASGPGKWTFVAGEWVAADHELLVYVTTDVSGTISTPFVGSQSSVPNSTGQLRIGASTVGSSSTASSYWSGGICNPVVIQGIADIWQLHQLALLTAPHALTPPNH